MPSLKKGGFFSPDMYICDKCGKEFIYDSEAAGCEERHIRDTFNEEIIKQMEEKKDVEGLINALENLSIAVEKGDSGHMETCLEATADALGVIGDVRAVEPLIKALEIYEKIEDTQYLDSSLSIMLALGEIGDMRAVEPIIEVFRKEEDCLVLQHAVIALGKLGDERAIEPLIEALGHDNWTVREYVPEALGEIGDKQAVEPLIKALSDENCKIRQNAAMALGDIGDTRAVEPLIRSLGDIDDDVHRVASEALAKIDGATDTLVQALGDDDERVRLANAEVLDKLNWKPNTEKQQIAYSLAKQEWAELVKLGEPAVQSLIKALEDNVSDVCREAANSLGKIGDARAIEPLIKIFIKLRVPSEISAVGDVVVDAKNTVKYLGKKLVYTAVANALKKLPGVGAKFERLELYDKAEEWYQYHDMLEEAAAMRRKKADLAAPKTEIHGDYIDDRDTIVKDSVINRSSIGAGGKSKGEQIKVIKDLLDSGAIDDAEFKQMKNEILGK